MSRSTGLGSLLHCAGALRSLPSAAIHKMTREPQLAMTWWQSKPSDLLYPVRVPNGTKRNSHLTYYRLAIPASNLKNGGWGDGGRHLGMGREQQLNQEVLCSKDSCGFSARNVLKVTRDNLGLTDRSLTTFSPPLL